MQQQEAIVAMKTPVMPNVTWEQTPKLAYQLPKTGDASRDDANPTRPCYSTSPTNHLRL